MKNYKKKQLGKLSSLLMIIPIVGLGYAFDLAEKKGLIVIGVFESSTIDKNSFVTENGQNQNHGRMHHKSYESNLVHELSPTLTVDVSNLKNQDSLAITPYIKTNILVPRQK